MDYRDKRIALARELLDCSCKSIEHVKILERTAQGAERKRLEEILSKWEALVQMAEEEIRDITTAGAPDEATRRTADETLLQIRETQERIRAYMKTLHEKQKIKK